VKERLLTTVHRRDLLRFAIAGTGAATASTLVPEPVAATHVDLNEKRKARYQASSEEVQTFIVSTAIQPDKGDVRADQKIGTSSKPWKRRRPTVKWIKR
jgi:hypothetical protein